MEMVYGNPTLIVHVFLPRHALSTTAKLVAALQSAVFIVVLHDARLRPNDANDIYVIYHTIISYYIGAICRGMLGDAI